MKILKKGTLTIDGKDCRMSGYELDCRGENMLPAILEVLEEGVRDLQAQIAEARVDGVEITDGGDNQLNGVKWEFPFGVKAKPSNEIPSIIRLQNHYQPGAMPFNLQSDPTAPFFRMILRQATYFLLVMLAVGVGLAVFL